MPRSRSRRKVYYINLLKKWYKGQSKETACMVQVKDSESGEELDNVPSWKKDGGLEYTVSEQYVQRRGTTGSAVAEVPGCIQD